MYSYNKVKVVVSGCAAAVEIDPAADGNVSYSDNSWHHLVATRSAATGVLEVDGKYTGMLSYWC